MHERVSTTLSNEECLPQAHVLPPGFYYRLLLLYLGIVLLIYQSTTFLRLRRVICSYFYHKREKQRILYLYNAMLRDRLTVFAQPAAQCHNESGHAPWAKRRCLICDALEDGDFELCAGCGLPYCRESGLFLKNVCIQCGLYITQTPPPSGTW
ncbi:GL15342 [Drosophila persimilis]|uniref:GL15342 n=1 Tax=Drosophila persimilis TaxID=7234 RepID=B4HCU5_DROPE|nr:GL15342 [Drosophila persimilis]